MRDLASDDSFKKHVKGHKCVSGTLSTDSSCTSNSAHIKQNRSHFVHDIYNLFTICSFFYAKATSSLQETIEIPY